MSLLMKIKLRADQMRLAKGMNLEEAIEIRKEKKI